MHTPAIQNLLAQFDRLSGTYMRAEVEEAVAQQEAITPHLLRILEDVGTNPLRYSLEGGNAHVYAALLLSHFREPAAHLLFIRAFSIAEEQLMDLWGDMTTETLPTLLYQTCAGSISAIKELIGNREVDQYARCAAMEALSYVVAFDPLQRDEVINFFQGLFSGSEADPDSYFWGNLTATLCDLHPGESMEIIRKAFADGVVRPGFIGLADVEQAAARNKEESATFLRAWVTARMPADIHAYISWFAEFNHEDAFASPTSPSPADQKSKKSAKNNKTGGTKNKTTKKAKKKNQR
jgi:hypothetical protein